MKVLWHEETHEEQENESDMKKFLTESEIKLSQDQMEQLLLALQRNSLWVPDGARELQGWNIGLLERFTNQDLAEWNAEVHIR